MDLASALAELATISDQKTKIERYKAVLQDLLAQQHVAHLQGFLEHLLAEDVPLVLSRQVLQELAVGLKKLPPAQLKEVGEFALGRVANRAVSFEEQVAHVREALADVYEGEEEWAAAAKMLAAIPLDSGYVTRTDGYKVEKYIKIAMLYLQDDDSVSAETFINRASLLVTEETDGELRLQHKVCYARILDAKRKFLEAGTRFYQLSTLATKSLGEGKQVGADPLLPHAARPAITRPRPSPRLPPTHLQVDEAELLTALTHSITCALLAPAGPQRSRLLGMLYKDERAPKAPSYGILTKARATTLDRRRSHDAHRARHPRSLTPPASSLPSRRRLRCTWTAC